MKVIDLKTGRVIKIKNNFIDEAEQREAILNKDFLKARNQLLVVASIFLIVELIIRFCFN